MRLFFHEWTNLLKSKETYWKLWEPFSFNSWHIMTNISTVHYSFQKDIHKTVPKKDFAVYLVKNIPVTVYTKVQHAITSVVRASTSCKIYLNQMQSLSNRNIVLYIIGDSTKNVSVDNSHHIFLNSESLTSGGSGIFRGGCFDLVGEALYQENYCMGFFVPRVCFCLVVRFFCV